MNLISAKGIRVQFEGRHGQVTLALDDVDLAVAKGECVALVGESGSGKTTLGKVLLGLQKPDQGQVIFHHEDKDVEVTSLHAGALRELWQHTQMIFQDPYAALNPRMTVSEIIGEPLSVRSISKGRDLETAVRQMADFCGISSAQLSRYPHAFSGGQRQRIAIARALILKPAFIVCDEPVAALDVSIRAQIINLLKDLQAELALSYLFITHDLSLVPHIANRVAVMQAGRIVEEGETLQVMESPGEPYTARLMAALPRVPADLGR